MSAQLRDLGVTTGKQVMRVPDARVILEHKAYDIVLCAQRLDGSAISGQELADELRREQLLSLVLIGLQRFDARLQGLQTSPRRDAAGYGAQAQ